MLYPIELWVLLLITAKFPSAQSENIREGVEFQAKIYKTLQGKATTLHAELYMFFVGQTT